jgi:hypothetical protein
MFMTKEAQKPEHEHEFKESLEVDLFYPDHPPRKESNLFSKTKRHLVHDLDTPCWVCGSKESREVHHFHVEWAFADGVDWDKMKVLHPDFNWSTFKSAEDFVDSEYNMMVLCAEHHRHKDRGIHNLPYPLWIMERNKRADFILFKEEASKAE